MNIDNECYIVYDKNHKGNNSFSNPEIKEYTINKLFVDLFKDSKMIYMTGDKAIDEFNSKNTKLPEDINKDIYTFHLFNYDKIITVLIIGIDITKFTKYYDANGAVPNKDFITKACRFHIGYNNNLSAMRNDENIIDDITKDALIPKCNIIDDLISDNINFIKKSIKLFDYQKKTIQWMLNVENRDNKLYYGNNYNSEIHIGSFTFDIISGTLIPFDKRNHMTFNGGALIDEVGLGKTIQALVLCLLNPSPVDELSYVKYIDDKNKILQSRASLIICPNHLCQQWDREISKMLITDNLRVVKILTKTHFNQYTYQDLLDADFVILSYNFIGNYEFAKKYTSEFTTSKSYHKSYSWNDQTVEKVFTRMRNETASSPSSLFKTEALFPLIYWRRVIIDEYHEVITLSKYVYVKNILPHIMTKYKWIITGTPFDKHDRCFNSMIDFVTNGKNSKTCIRVPELRNYIKNNFFRRNTKKSIEIKLPELKEKIFWLKFSQTERMIYNAYLSDTNISKYSEIVRQICCHPKIAEETRQALKGCKTLKDIEKSMVTVYKNQYEAANKDVKKCQMHINKTERRILVTDYRRQRKFLKKLGYRVKVELSKFIDDIDSDNEAVEETDSDDGGDDLNIENSESDSDDDEDTKTIIVNEKNKKENCKLIEKQLKENPSKRIGTLTEILKKQKQRLSELEKICEGKKSSYTFFNNMLERIKKTFNKESGGESSEDENCSVCLSEISGDNVGVTSCGHMFCYECIKANIKINGKCPLCRKVQKLTDVSLISFEKPKIALKGDIKNKLDLINRVGTKLANLIYYIKSIPDNIIIFSQWDSLLKRVADILSEYGISNVSCKGNVWSRDRAIRDFSNDSNIRVIMLSSESVASGVNLTKATKIILLDPVSGTYENRKNIEWQAIGRAYRLGQTKPVEIVRFIIKDTVEEDIYEENKIDDATHKHNILISETTDDVLTLSDDVLKSMSK